jgi:hypothetical protein
VRNVLRRRGQRSKADGEWLLDLWLAERLSQVAEPDRLSA